MKKYFSGAPCTPDVIFMKGGNSVESYKLN